MQHVLFTIANGIKYYIRDTGTHYLCVTDINKATKMSVAEVIECKKHFDNVSAEPYQNAYSICI